MKGKGKLIVWAAVLVVLLAGSALALRYWDKVFQLFPPTIDNETEALEKAPDFMAYDLAGNAVALSDMLGKPVVLNLWASWCPPCREEMPAFDKLYAELGAEVQFMMVDMVDGWGETVETGSAYVAEQGFAFPVYFDTDGAAAVAYGVRSIPKTIFIDKDGSIVITVIGMMSEEALRENIEKIAK